MWFQIFILLFSVINTVYLEVMVKNANNYGPFTVSIDEYGGCKGPKSQDVATMVTTVDKKLLLGVVNFTFLTDAKIDEIKVYVHTIKEGRKVFLWNYKLNAPCKHFAIAAMINQHLKATNCLVKKGSYHSLLNYGEVMNSFLGGSFFYGTYTYKADLTSKKGNIGCFNSTLTFKKKV